MGLALEAFTEAFLRGYGLQIVSLLIGVSMPNVPEPFERTISQAVAGAISTAITVAVMEAVTEAVTAGVDTAN